MEFDILIALHDWLSERDSKIILALQPVCPIKHHDLLSIGKDAKWLGSVWLKLRGPNQKPVFETRMLDNWGRRVGDPIDYDCYDPRSFESVYQHIFGTKHEAI